MADEPAPPIRVVASQLAGQRGPGEWDRRLVESVLPTTAVKGGLTRFLAQIQEIIDITKGTKLGDFQLEEMSFAAEVGPDGEFKLIGTGDAGLTAGIRFTVRRKHVPETADLVRVQVGTVPEEDGRKNAFKHDAYVRGVTDQAPVKVRVEGVVNTFETSSPLPVKIT